MPKKPCLEAGKLGGVALLRSGDAGSSQVVLMSSFLSPSGAKVFIERLGIARSFEEVGALCCGLSLPFLYKKYQEIALRSHQGHDLKATHCLWALLLCHLAAAALLLALMKPRFEGARPRPKAVVACA